MIITRIARFTANDPVSLTRADAELCGQLVCRQTGVGVASAQLCNTRVGQHDRSIAFAPCGGLRVGVSTVSLAPRTGRFRAKLRRQSSLRRAVAHVVSVGPKPQVGGVDTSRVITTGAVVKDKQSVGDGAVCQNPRHPRSVVTMPVKRKTSIALVCAMCQPRPARIRPAGTVNLRPEPLSNRRLGAALTVAITSSATVSTNAARDMISPRLEGCAADFAFAINPERSILGGHCEVLSRGAEPRRSSHRAGTFRSHHFTRNPHIYARFRPAGYDDRVAL